MDPLKFHGDDKKKMEQKLFSKVLHFLPKYSFPPGNFSIHSQNFCEGSNTRWEENCFDVQVSQGPQYFCERMQIFCEQMESFSAESGTFASAQKHYIFFLPFLIFPHHHVFP